VAEKSLPKVNRIDQPYWQGAAEGRLLLQRCRACGKLQFFPRAVCTGCFGADIGWIQASGKGKIHSFTWIWTPRNPAFKDEVPICYASIVLIEGVLMQSRIVGAALEKVQSGAEVNVAFLSTADPCIKLPVFELA
jgi:hypothetical protein